MTFQLIDQERAHHAFSLLCSVLNVSRQGFWAWKRRPLSRRRRDDERLKAADPGGVEALRPDLRRAARARRAAGGCSAWLLRSEAGGGDRRADRPRSALVQLMEELIGCRIAGGTIDAILSRTAETLGPVYEELLEQTRTAGALNIDETGWYLSGEPRTLWGAFSKQTAVLRIAPDRGKQHLHGESFNGIVGSDRFSAYNSLEPEQRQVCWSHLRRDFTFHADLGSGPQETFGLDGLEVTWNVFQAWKQFQQGADRAALRRRIEAAKDQLWPLLEWGSIGKRQRHVHALAKNLLKLWPALWTFADVPGVEPTNNAAERGLRAQPSSTASSPSAAAPRAASARSRDCSRSTRPAGSNAARSTATSPTPSSPKPAAPRPRPHLTAAITRFPS
jgi:Transposase IS66 family